MSVNLYQTKLRKIPENWIIYSHCPKNLKSEIFRHIPLESSTPLTDAAFFQSHDRPYGDFW